jgi:hypothetical protein
VKHEARAEVVPGLVTWRVRHGPADIGVPGLRLKAAREERTCDDACIGRVRHGAGAVEDVEDRVAREHAVVHEFGDPGPESRQPDYL